MRNLSRWLVIAFAAGAIFVGLAGSPAPAPKYTNVKPIFAKYCVACHTGPNAPKGVQLNSFQGILRGGSSGKILIPGKPDTSLILKLMKGTKKPIMPPAGARATSGEIATIYEWIKAGAKQ